MLLCHTFLFTSNVSIQAHIWVIKIIRKLNLRDMNKTLSNQDFYFGVPPYFFLCRWIWRSFLSNEQMISVYLTFVASVIKGLKAKLSLLYVLFRYRILYFPGIFFYQILFWLGQWTKEVSKNQSTYFIPFYECSLTGSFPARSSTQNIDSSMRNRCCFPVEFLSL